MPEHELFDHEVWEELAGMIEGAGSMPCAGLCSLLHAAAYAGIIDGPQRVRMEIQLRSWRVDNHLPVVGYIYPPFQLAPRIRLCRELAQATLEAFNEESERRKRLGE